MRTDNRLPRVLHVLLHLEDAEMPLTSQMMGKMLNMNPSLVRRTMSGLREAGFVTSTKGHNGGWQLTKPLSDFTLAAVYQALGEPNLFAVGVSDQSSNCLLEKAANVATQAALEKARKCFLDELGALTVAELVENSREQIKAYQKTHQSR
ncbi:MAG: Rrf2 family transcriptional regulator [Lentilitoribacter sp.]